MCGSGSMARPPKRAGWSRISVASNSLHARATATRRAMSPVRTRGVSEVIATSL